MIIIKDINSKTPKWDWTKIIFIVLGIAILIALIAIFYVSRKNIKAAATDGKLPAGNPSEPAPTNITPESVTDMPVSAAETESNATHITPEKAIEMAK